MVVIFKTIQWARHVVRMEETRNVYRILMRKPLGTRPLGKMIWKAEIKLIYYRETDCDGEMWMQMAQDGVQLRTLVLVVSTFGFYLLKT
jgi:hypothetical protein